MVYILYALFFISCIALIASVLLQPGKTDAGALFTSNVSSTAFQPRGSQTILSKITIAAASAFMLSALLLAMPALTGNLSVLQTNTDNQTETEPAVDSNANANIDANSATNANVETNPGALVNGNIAVNSNSAIVIPANSNSTVVFPANPNTNAPRKIDEPKPVEKAPANK